MRVICIVQARMGSSRLPGKSMMLLGGRPLIEHVLERAQQIRNVDRVVLTTPDTEDDKPIQAVATRLGVKVYPEDHSDLLGAFARVAATERADVIVRVTGDCALLNVDSSSKVVEHHLNGDRAYTSNVLDRGTDGWDTEVFSRFVLRLADRMDQDPLSRAHVTPWIRKNIECETFVPALIPHKEKLSVDTLEDLMRVRLRYAQQQVPV